MDKLKELIDLCSASVSVEVNGHKDVYMPVIDYMLDSAGLPIRVGSLYTGDIELFSSKMLEELELDLAVYNGMVKRDTIVYIQFYPNTPV